MRNKLIAYAILPLLLFCLGQAADSTSTQLPDSSQVQAKAGASDSSVALLPDRMGPMENLLWGRDGLIRSAASLPLTEENREKEMKWRRTLLTTHQIMGLATLGAMVTTVVYGQRILNENNFNLRGAHSTWAGITIGAYTATALLAFSTPPPMVRRGEWSTVSWHKALAWVHLTGMVLTPIVGSMIQHTGTLQSVHQVELFHQVSGYVTTAAFAGAIMVVTF
jgi:hypothetical protein